MTTDLSINSPTENRPMTFTEVIGQPFARGVGKMIGKGNISGQGYILAGPKGCGKTTVARIIAKSLNCENRDAATGDPCNACVSCIAVDQGTHPLVYEINAASKRGINEIREALQSMHYAVNKGYRVYILDEMHMLTKEAFSVLLKPMEEPPENVVFVATTTNPEAILDTIVSRVPIIPIKPLNDAELQEVLRNVVERGKQSEVQEWHNVTEDDIRAAVLAAQGSARQAITNLSGVVFHGVSTGSTLQDVQLIVDAFRDRSVSGVLSASLKVLGNKEHDPLVVVTQLLASLVDVLYEAPQSEVEILSREIASLSQVSQEIRQSSQTTMTAARIASCVIAGDVQPAVQNASQPSGAHIVKNLSEEEVFEILFSTKSKKTLARWMPILDDQDASDIYIEGDTLIVAVKDLDQSLLRALRQMFDKVELNKLR